MMVNSDSCVLTAQYKGTTRFKTVPLSKLSKIVDVRFSRKVKGFPLGKRLD